MSAQAAPVAGSLPKDACCQGCGYLLRGLPQPVCPECGRAFDPLDPTSFDIRSASRTWRKWLIRGALAAVLGGALFPRGYSKGTITFTCTLCGSQQTVVRWEVYPALWTRIRFPGYCAQPSTSAASATTGPTGSCHHEFGVNAVAEFYRFTLRGAVGGVGLKATGHARSDSAVAFNGVVARPETAGEALHALVKQHPDGGYGVSVSEVLGGN